MVQDPDSTEAFVMTSPVLKPLALLVTNGKSSVVRQGLTSMIVSASRLQRNAQPAHLYSLKVSPPMVLTGSKLTATSPLSVTSPASHVNATVNLTHSSLSL